METNEEAQDDTERATEGDEPHDRSTAGSAGTVASNARRSTDESSREGGAGEALGRRFDSARNTLGEPGPKSQLTFVIGLFGVVGAGFGVTGVVVIALIAGGDSGTGGAFLAGLFLISLLVVVLLTGPIVGAFSGLRVAARLDDSSTTYLTSFVSTAVGYVVMVIVAAVLIGLVAGGGGGGAETGGESANPFDIASLLLPLVALAIPVGLTGLGSSYLARWNSGR